MIRKILITSVAGLGVALPFSHSPSVEAHPPVIAYHRATFEVMYRQYHHWHCYGTYLSRSDAERAARHLARHGYEVRVAVR
jgi:hypothetical protein